MGRLSFVKMHGAGNDYVFLDCHSRPPMFDLSALARRVSDRRRGVGADGLVLITCSETVDFGMRMFNADGSEAEMCGNAARCVGKYVFERGLTTKQTIALETLSGVRRLYLSVDGNGKVRQVAVDMGHPVFEPAKIPVLAADSMQIPVATSCGKLTLTAVSVGNPHGVVFCHLEDIDVCKLGQELECHPLFPQRANIEFVEFKSRDRLQMRVWERGSGETLSCGTGACAAVAAGVATGKCDRHAVVEAIGGCLEVEWKEADGRLFLSGPAEFSFEGTIEI